MERDNITRVYITSAGPFACEVYPKRGTYLRANEASAVINRAEFHALNVESPRKENGSLGEQASSQWAVCPKPTGTSFVIDRKNWQPSERYAKLAEELEKQAEKSGLTITVFIN